MPGEPLTGSVLSSTNNISKVLLEDGRILLCAIKGKRIKTLAGSYNGLAVGDIVEVIPTDGGKGLIASLRERRNTFGRYNEKGRAEQAIAANIDIVFCVSSPHLPPFRPRFIDRLAVLAECAKVPFVIVLNKTDLGVPDDVDERLAAYRSLGYGIIRASATLGEGVDEIRALLRGAVGVFAGQSGVGKSSLLNAIVPGLDRRIQDVSIKYDRGKHTTTMAEMVRTEDGLRIIDTPGIRRLALRSIDPDDLASCFPEIFPYVEHCAFGSRCSHSEEEGCAVRAAAERAEIHPDRYESYLRIREELEQPVTWKKPGNRDPGRRDRALTPHVRGRPRGSGIDRRDEDDDDRF